MRNFYRMLAILTVFTGVGHLVVEWSRLQSEYRSIQTKADRAEVRASRGTLKKICNWRIYEATSLTVS